MMGVCDRENLPPDAVSDNAEIMKYSIPLLRVHQIWLPKGQAKPTFSYWFKLFLTILAGSVLLMIIVASEINALKSEDKAFDIISEFVAYIVSMVGGIWVVVTSVAYRDRLHRLLREVCSFARFGEPQDLRETSRYLNMAIIIIYCYVCLAFVVQSGHGLLTAEACEREYAQRGYRVVCGFVDTMLMLDGDTPLVRACLFVYAVVSSFFIMQPATLMLWMFFESNVYLILKVRHLVHKLETAFDPENGREQQERLKECIRYHIHIMRLAKEMNNCFKNIIAAHALMSGVVFALLGNLIVLKQKLPDVMHLMGWVYLTFMSCLTGQSITSQSELISSAIYNSRWYNAKVFLQKDLIPMQMMSRTPLVLNGGAFVTLSYPLFAAICKSSYSYLAFIQSTKEEDE